jgi:hypothetical protein
MKLRREGGGERRGEGIEERRGDRGDRGEERRREKRTRTDQQTKSR